ncbi:C39 family peptidase [Ruminococcus sp. HUN007]|uniref:C39 family peptidase n=1 Tax=Ruminococcus sp. HUN007 TaxID=1514668 RepID=UPI000AC04B9B|nr:C39 family peptidase [Ruminococcus sp. HUN007]
MNKKISKIIPAALIAAPLLMNNPWPDELNAASNTSIAGLKNYIFGNILQHANYDAALDTNSDNCLDVFDIIRFKQEQYSIGTCGLDNKPAVTTGTSAVTSGPAETGSTEVTTTNGNVITETSAVTEITTGAASSGQVSESITFSETTAFVSLPASTEVQVTEALTTTVTETQAGVTTAPVSSETTAASGTTAAAVTSEVTTSVPVTSSVTTTTAPVTTAVTTTTSAPAATTVTTTTSAPVTTTVTTTTAAPVTTAVTTTTPAPVTKLPEKKIISSVKSMLQSPELPTGCEATGLTIAVRWYGYDVSKTDIAMKYMPRQDFHYSGGKLIGADFITTFAGDPSRNDLSYGCYIPCMVKTVDNYFQAVGSSYRGKDISGKELEDLFPYIANNIPVVVISTPELVNPRTGDSWYTADGRYVTWQRGHHCTVLIGYDKTRSKVYCADPMMLKGVVEWDIAQFKNIYNQKGKHAMIIDTGSVTPPKKALKEGDQVRFAGWLNTSSDGKGTDKYIDSGVYTITKILDPSLERPVNIGNSGWASYDAIYENQPYFGNGTPSAPTTPENPATPSPSSNAVTALTNGQVYNIVNCMSRKYLNVDYGKDADGTNIYQWTSDGSTEQKFKAVSASDAWKLLAMCSSSGGNRMVTAVKPDNGENVYLFKPTNDVTQLWTLTKIKDGVFAIGLKAYPGYVLTVPDYNNGSASGTSKSSGGNVFISKYTGAENQLWYFEKK